MAGRGGVLSTAQSTRSDSTYSRRTFTIMMPRAPCVTCRHVVHSWCTPPGTTARPDGPRSTRATSWLHIMASSMPALTSVWTKTLNVCPDLTQIQTTLYCMLFRVIAGDCHVLRTSTAESWHARCALSEPDTEQFLTFMIFKLSRIVTQIAAYAFWWKCTRLCLSCHRKVSINLTAFELFLFVLILPLILENSQSLGFFF